MAIAGLVHQITEDRLRDVAKNREIYYCQATFGSDDAVYDEVSNSCIFYGNMEWPIKEGDIVLLRADVLKRHARSVPAHAGYTREQFKWRDTLRDLEGERGTVTRVFDGSKHVNVQFKDTIIGIEHTELVVLTD